jgi:predicted nucleotidyltransferase
MQLGAGMLSEQPFQQAQTTKEPTARRTQRHHVRKPKHPLCCGVPSICWPYDSKPCSPSRWSSMWEPAIALFPIFRSRITTAVLTKTYIGDSEHSIAELARLAHTDTGTMSREVKRLEAAGILCSRDVGRTKLVSANREAAFYRPLRDLVAITLGPAEVLGEELGRLEGIAAAAIFGSWAARATGEPGPSPNDIDLLVIGRTDRDELHEALIHARDRLGREVNPVVVSPSQWRLRTDPFLAELAGRPMVALPGFRGPLDLAGVR